MCLIWCYFSYVRIMNVFNAHNAILHYNDALCTLSDVLFLFVLLLLFYVQLQLINDTYIWNVYQRAVFAGYFLNDRAKVQSYKEGTINNIWSLMEWTSYRRGNHCKYNLLWNICNEAYGAVWWHKVPIWLVQKRSNWKETSEAHDVYCNFTWKWGLPTVLWSD